MGKNTGKPAQDEFERHWRGLGKQAYCIPFYDAAYLRGLNDGHVEAPRQPADYLVTHNGVTFYAEVKSTENPTRFKFSMLRTNQWAAAHRVTVAGGEYFVFVKSLKLNRWFRVPASYIKLMKDIDVKSTPWDAMAHFKWEC